MKDDGQSSGARLSSTEEMAVFTSAARDPSAKEPEARHGFVSSGPFVIAPASLSSSSSSPPPSALGGPPSAVVQNAMERGRPRTSLGAVVGIGAAIFVVLVGLSLLLFR